LSRRGFIIGKERQIKAETRRRAKHVAEERQPPSGASAFSRRIAHLIRLAGNASMFARMCGVSESVVRKWRDGLSEPSRLYLERIVRHAGVSVEWLVTGEGAMQLEASQVSRHRVSEPPRAGYAALPPWKEGLPVASATPSVEEGAGGDAFVFSEDWLRFELDARPQDLCLLRVAGDSMEPTLRAGDMILIDRRATRPDRESIYLLRMDGMLLARRLQALPGGLVKVSSDNPAVDAFQASLADIGSGKLSIFGRVVWAGRRL
jgi:phage repressor protein C with HTH and peptisase S24 domain